MSKVPLFLVYAARVAHYPIQAPRIFQKRANIAPIFKVLSSLTL